MARQMVRDVMSPEPVCVKSTDTLHEAARQMKRHNIGDVLVLEGGGGHRLAGVVTDRDIVVRCIAANKDARAVTAGDIASPATVTIAPDAGIDDAVRLMRDNALRRLPVVEGAKIVGVISLGDLAMNREPRSALADISAAPPTQ